MQEAINHSKHLIWSLSTDVAAVALLKLDHRWIGHEVSTW